MPDKDLDRLMHDFYGDDGDRAPERLADRVHAIPDVEPAPAPATWRWLRRLAWWRADRGPRANGNGRHRSVVTAAATATAIFVLVVGVLLVGSRLTSDRAPDEPATEPSVLTDDGSLAASLMEARSATLRACRTGQAIEPLRSAWREVDAGEDGTYEGGVRSWRLSSTGSIYGEDEPRLEGTMTQVRNQAWTHDDNGRELSVQRNATRIENDGGSWDGSSTRFSGNRAVETMAQEVVTLTGAGGYAGRTAIIQLPASDDRPECFEIYGIVVEDGLVPMPSPYEGDPADIPTGTE